MTETFSILQHRHMARALELGETARLIAPPNPAVGCVIALNDKILGEGATSAPGGAHAEIAALDDAKARNHSVSGATAYVTLEPCSHQGRTPPCTDSLIAAGITSVIVAVSDPDPRVNGDGIAKLRDAGISVQTGLLETEARDQHRNFFHRVASGRPRIRVKLASSVDGRTAMASGESKWITGTAAREDVQRLRAESDCILSGSGTVLADNPGLDVRLSAESLGLVEGEVVRQPLRVILDSQLRTPADARLFQCGGDLRIYSAVENNNNYNELGSKVNVISGFTCDSGGIDLVALFAELAAIPVNLVHVEAGPTLCGALLHARLVDEIVVYLAPHIMGSEARPQFELPGITTMSQRLELKLETVRQLGDDLCLSYQVT